jgi:phosphonate transport system permease protein
MTAGTSDPILLRPKEPLAPKIIRWLVVIGILVPLIWSMSGLELSWQRLIEAPGRVWNIVRLMIPPDLSPAAIQRALPKVMESLLIAWVGTMIAAFISLPMAFVAAQNTGSKIFGPVVRFMFIIIRTIPEIVLAMFLIPVAGLGPWLGTLAIGIHSIGTLGKLSMEVIEGSDKGPVEAIAGVGGGRISQVRFAVLPQVLPTIMAYWLYRFEINMRASAVIGLVGGGGIGLELQQQLQFRDYGRAGLILFLTIVVVLIIDTISARIRRRIITGNREPGPVAIFQKAQTGKKIAMLTFSFVAAYCLVFLFTQLQAAA